jgi:integrase
MFNLAIDSKLRGCDVVSLTVEDVAPNGVAIDRATVRQKKTGHPVRFELSEQTREAVDTYIGAAHKKAGEFLFTSRRYPGHSRPDSTPVLYPGGSPGSAWIQHCMALTRSAVPRPRSFIVRPATYVPSSSC